jgi:hypothetical protein
LRVTQRVLPSTVAMCVFPVIIQAASCLCILWSPCCVWVSCSCTTWCYRHMRVTISSWILLLQACMCFKYRAGTLLFLQAWCLYTVCGWHAVHLNVCMCDSFARYLCSKSPWLGSVLFHSLMCAVVYQGYCGGPRVLWWGRVSLCLCCQTSIWWDVMTV